MVISNIGTIILSFPPDLHVVYPSSASSDRATSEQVRILSISNTLSRLVMGPLADFVSPAASCFSAGMVVYPRKHRVSRIVFLAVPALLSAFIFTWMEFGAISRQAVRTLRFVDSSISASYLKNPSQCRYWYYLWYRLHCAVS